MIGLSNCRREMQILGCSAFKGSCPNSVSSFQLLENVAPELRSWCADVHILMRCSHSHPESRLSVSLVCEACQLLSRVFLARNFHVSLQTQLCRLEFLQCEKRTAVSDSETSPPFLRHISVFVTRLVCEVAEIPPQMVTLMTGCIVISLHPADLLLREKGTVKHLVRKPVSACALSPIFHHLTPNFSMAPLPGITFPGTTLTLLSSSQVWARQTRHIAAVFNTVLARPKDTVSVVIQLAVKFYQVIGGGELPSAELLSSSLVSSFLSNPQITLRTLALPRPLLWGGMVTLSLASRMGEPGRKCWLQHLPMPGTSLIFMSASYPTGSEQQHDPARALGLVPGQEGAYGIDVVWTSPK